MNYEQDASSVKPDNAESHFSSYAAPLVDQAVAHAAELRENPDAEVLHKLRVALRRLRSLLWAYRPLLDRDLDDKQRALLKHLAGAAGRTRDWDILIELLGDVLEEDQLPIDRLRVARSAVAEESRETLTHAGIQSQLEDAVASSSVALDSAHQSTPLKKFARRRVQSAQKSLHRRMHRASRSKRSDYDSYHEVRKAGKKVRYLLDFFEPLLAKKQLKMTKELKRLQKRFGALNDVVASEELLSANPEIFDKATEIKKAHNALQRERKARALAAGKLLQ